MFGKQKLLVCMQKVPPPQKKSDNLWPTVKKPDMDEKISERPRKKLIKLVGKHQNNLTKWALS